MNISIGSTLRVAGLVGAALGVVCAGACGSPSTAPVAARPSSTPPVASASPSAAPTPASGSPAQAGVHFQPSAADPNTWPDACQMLTATQLATVWPGAFAQVGTYGSFFGGGNTPHYTTCKYTQNTAAGDLIIVSVNVIGVQPLPNAQQRFASDARTSQGIPETGLGDEAFYDHVYGQLEVRQAGALWSVVVNESDDTSARQPHTERLAKLIASEIGS